MISMMSSPLTRISTRLQHNINSWINIQTWTPKEHRAVSPLPMLLNSMHVRPIPQATTAWVTFSHWHRRARTSRLVWGCRSRVQAAAIPRAQKFQVGSIYLKCSQAWSMITKAVSKLLHINLRYPRIHRMGAISSASPISRTKSTSAWAPSSSSASSSPTQTHKKQQKAACKASKAKSRSPQPSRQITITQATPTSKTTPTTLLLS